jgi:hypothetical protein
MATTTNYGWTTPDDTALVKDGAAAIRSLGTAIDTSFAADEGDLLVGGTSDIFEALPIGAAGTVLTSDGDTAEWVAPGGSTADWTLLNSGGTSLTGSSVTISGISNKTALMVIIESVSGTNASSTLQISLNNDSGSNYKSAGLVVRTSSAFSTDISSTSWVNAGSFFQLGQMSGVATSRGAGYFRLEGANSAGVKMAQWGFGFTPESNSGQVGRSWGGAYTSSSTISSIKIEISAGTMDDGTVFVYGTEA